MRNKIFAFFFSMTCGLTIIACTVDQPTAPNVDELELGRRRGHAPKPPKITICHRSMKRGQVRYKKLRVSANAEQAHRAHGDALSGEPVPGMDGFVFDNRCKPMEEEPLPGGIDIEKATNGVDADDPNAGDAPQITPGNLVSWTYVVTNTGAVTLTNLVVIDDQGVAVSCPVDTLSPGQSMTCTASGTAEDLTNTAFTTVTGLCGPLPNTQMYQNIGQVSGTAAGQSFQDSDPSHYCNTIPPTTLTLNNVVINDEGGTAVVNDFQAKIDGGDVPWGVAQSVGAGSFTASVTVVAGYTAGGWSGDCAPDGSVTLALGESKICTITHEDDTPLPTPGPCLQQAIDRHDDLFDPDWDWNAGGPWEVTQDDINQYEVLTRGATGTLAAPAAVVSFSTGTCGVAPEGANSYTTSDGFPLSDLEQAKAFLQSLVG